MADFKALIHNAGRASQIGDSDDLLTGSGLKNASGNLTITPAGTDIVLAAGKTLSAAAGAGAVDFSNMTGGFTTSTGAVTVGPGTTTMSGTTTFTAAGTALTVNNNAAITGTLTNTGQINANGGIGRSSAGALSIGEDANTTSVDISKVGALTTIKGNFQVDGTEVIVGGTTFNADVTFGDANTDTVTFRSKVQGHGDNSGDIVPVADNTTGLGSSSLRFADLNATSVIARADATDTLKATLTASGLQSTVTGSDFAIDITQNAVDTAGRAVTITGGAGGDASASAGGAGGAVTLAGAVGGDGTGALAAGAGGATSLTGGAAGADGGGGGANGGAVTIDGGAASGAGTAGAVSIGGTTASSVAIGRSGITTTVTGALTQQTGQVTLNGNVDATAGLDVSGAALTIDNQAITQTTGGQVTFAGNVDANGGLDVTGNLSQGTGTVSLTANGASSFTTSSGALTITAAAASTWSTAAGALTLNGTGGMNLQTAGSTRLAVADAALTVQAGVTLATTGTGNINLPNNASARFQVEGSAVGATVTAANLDTLTDGSNADALHVHSSGTADNIAIAATSGEALAAGAPVIIDDASGSPKVFNSDADGAGELADCLGLAAAAAAGADESVNVNVNGEQSVADAIFDSLPGTSDVGKRVYLSANVGKLTLTAPTAAGTTALRVGFITSGGTGAVKVAIDVGEGIVN